MKKSFFAISMILITLLSFSCGNGKKQADAGDQSVATTYDESGRAKEVTLVPSILFYEKGSLWYENSKGELERKTVLTQGQVVYAYPAEADSESEIVEVRKMKRSGQTAEESYLKVSYDNGEYWINSDLVVPNATPRVVCQESMNYTKDDIDGVSSVKVPQGKIVAVHNDYSNPNSDIAFVKVTWRKGDERSYRSVYLKADVVSTAEDDIVALRVLSKLDSIKNPDVRAELIENSSSLDVSDFLRDALSEAKYAVVGDN